VQIEDYPAPIGESDYFVLKRAFTLASAKPPANLWFRAAAAGKIETLSDGAFKIDDRLTLKIAGPGKPEVRNSGGKTELIVPVVFDSGKAKFTVTYDW
jgi:hypothetical protein